MNVLHWQTSMALQTLALHLPMIIQPSYPSPSLPTLYHIFQCDSCHSKNEHRKSIYTHMYLFIHIIKYIIYSGKYMKRNNRKGPAAHNFITTLFFQEKKISMGYVIEPKRPLHFIVLLCHGTSSTGLQL